MNLRSTSFADRPVGRSDRELLRDVSARVRHRRRVEIEELLDVVEWADIHTVTSHTGAATIREGHIDTGIPIAGPGAPLVSEFGLMELIATLERSPDGGRDYVGKVIELGWRLPQTFQAVISERCPVFKALRVADLTRLLSEQAAGYVDRNIAYCLGRVTWAQIERLVEEAVIRFDPVVADDLRTTAADHRHFDIDFARATDGAVPVEGLLDAADAHDLDQAITRRARQLGELGSSDSPDVRRSVAAGELARQDLTLDLQVVDTDTGEVTTAVPGRKVVLNLHLSEDAITAGTLHPEGAVGRWADQRIPIGAEQIRTWLGRPDTTIIVRPVIDLADHVPVDSYEIPDRLNRRVRLRDHHCGFPFCGRDAERCDLDHARPYAKGGPTCPCNLVPLCRRHHRAKTHSSWRSTIVEPGTYLWISPNGRHWLVDHRGTRALDPPRRLDPETMDVDHPWETGGRSGPVAPCPGTTPPPPT